MLVLSAAVLVAGGVGLAALEGRDDGDGTGETASDATTEPAGEGCDERLKVEPPDGAYLGVAVPDAPDDIPAVESFAAAAGKPAALVMWFVDWRTEFPSEAVERFADRGTIPVLTWEPTTAEAGSEDVELPEYRLAAIIGGQHDDYIRQFARDARDTCRPVMVRFAAEMNGNWHPWSEGVNGNRPGEYVQAWRHVHDIFRDEGATNVTWAWNPNVVGGTAATPLAGLYPGDEYVDWVGADGYNWGTLVPPWSRWMSFAEVFDQTLAELAALTSRPVMIGEFASTPEGGDKAAWIADMYAAIEARPAIRAFIWFEYQKETDWRIVSSPEAQAAFAAGAAAGTIVGAPVDVG